MEKIKINNSDGGFWIMVGLLIIFCYGDPDLLDSLIYWLNK